MCGPFNVGDWPKIPETYERILDYAGKHHLTFSGYAFEEGINEMVTKSMDEYVTQDYHTGVNPPAGKKLLLSNPYRLALPYAYCHGSMTIFNFSSAFFSIRLT